MIQSLVGGDFVVRILHRSVREMKVELAVRDILVPMKVYCPDCGAQIAAEDLNLQTLLARCR